jgi:hypothetical protein
MTLISDDQQDEADQFSNDDEDQRVTTEGIPQWGDKLIENVRWEIPIIPFHLI